MKSAHKLSNITLKLIDFFLLSNRFNQFPVLHNFLSNFNHAIVFLLYLHLTSEPVVIHITFQHRYTKPHKLNFFSFDSKQKITCSSLMLLESSINVADPCFPKQHILDPYSTAVVIFCEEIKIINE